MEKRIMVPPDGKRAATAARLNRGCFCDVGAQGILGGVISIVKAKSEGSARWTRQRMRREQTLCDTVPRFRDYVLVSAMLLRRNLDYPHSTANAAHAV